MKDMPTDEPQEVHAINKKWTEKQKKKGMLSSATKQHELSNNCGRCGRRHGPRQCLAMGRTCNVSKNIIHLYIHFAKIKVKVHAAEYSDN